MDQVYAPIFIALMAKSKRKDPSKEKSESIIPHKQSFSANPNNVDPALDLLFSSSVSYSGFRLISETI